MLWPVEEKCSLDSTTAFFEMMAENDECLVTLFNFYLLVGGKFWQTMLWQPVYIEATLMKLIVCGWAESN